MSTSDQHLLEVEPVISYPHAAQVGKSYLMTIDLRLVTLPETWPYDDEEYPVWCHLDTMPLFSHKPLSEGERAVVLHRFGGTYGPAKFLLTAAREAMKGTIHITLMNKWGSPIDYIPIEAEIKPDNVSGPVEDSGPDRRRVVAEALLRRVEDSGPDRRRAVAEALLRRRIHDMVHLHDETYIDSSLLTCAEYQLFLDEQRAQGKYYQPDHWVSFSFPAGTGRMPILGIRRSDAQAFCAWLTARDVEQWHYRLPQDEERPPQLSNGYQELQPEAGYWLEREHGFVWSRGWEKSPTPPSFIWWKGRPPPSLQQQFEEGVQRALDRLALPVVQSVEGRRDLVRTSEIVGGLELALDLDSANTRATVVTETGDVPGLIGVRESVGDGELAHDLEAASEIEVVRKSDSALDRNLVCARDRILAFDRACGRIYPDIAERLRRGSDYSGHRQMAVAYGLEGNLENALYPYVTLFLLQERRAGRFPAYEGILLVKESKERSRKRREAEARNRFRVLKAHMMTLFDGTRQTIFPRLDTGRSTGTGYASRETPDSMASLILLDDHGGGVPSFYGDYTEMAVNQIEFPKLLWTEVVGKMQAGEVVEVTGEGQHIDWQGTYWSGEGLGGVDTTPKPVHIKIVLSVSDDSRTLHLGFYKRNSDAQTDEPWIEYLNVTGSFE
jgi:hypothetical protein